MTISNTAPAREEAVFRAYSADDAAQYSQLRRRYSEALYEIVLAHHASTGGERGTVVDLGCGPGIATFQLADYFPHVVGLDPSEGMIATARASLASGGPEAAKIRPGHTVRFDVSTAEDIDPALLPDASVDMITAATCAHWFDMPRFWPSAARILKPGGTVALWCSCASKTHHSVPNSAAINAALQELEDAELRPYLEPGNLVTQRLYVDLGLPWTVDPPAPQFDEAAFVRRTFGMTDAEPPFHDDGFSRWYDLDTVERLAATMSPVTRWRQAHPGLVGTEEDIPRGMTRIMERYLREAGVEKGKEMVRGGDVGVLLMVKKRA